MYNVELALGRGIDADDLIAFARAIEHAHGIGTAVKEAVLTVTTEGGR